ncbi:hypoxanthine phosphoribosyltransferase [Mycoplasma bradburyae]|uniref:Hypoxanthine phosphoribosyltransferase n=1 Tax=Mycoplasma bradburyae TaxID=2963128 RepID=A0AAW6HR80_9MOLU|nr:hypoxanthine phosphoribosyltransferase [Mycoplasma bradburyae]MDC4163245.1 hypoxanthine phosphoribosyltransferase [Mycoplasma bradburyae]MDC4181859.1 hypoxanthine phosphoribosyltransferase [Mycoplasma bradburyae]MDC4182558.1 hypoxanthine phosphoribosyltransferase [Mycoplasma bradburyae]MDC4183236.1 hypoxanthine phosphoribosyltransferase [Mycoplasma bradburyae]MDC4184042.1 hypoxanthine phosphoribosyltransferase [Mycoplasma bradburyae]
MAKLNYEIEKVLITNEQINEAAIKAAKWINETYKDDEIVLVGILKGCIPFIGKIIDKIDCEVILDFMTLSSFKGETKSQGAPKIVMDLAYDVRDKNVLLVEDIIDSGNTIKIVLDLLKQRGAKSVKLLTFLDKPSGRKVDIKADYVCFEVPHGFLVGFGLDYKDKLRNLPFVGHMVLKD